MKRGRWEDQATTDFVQEVMTKGGIATHPLIQHKLSLMRSAKTTSKEFRELMYEITLILGVWSLSDLELTTRQPAMDKTPMGRDFQAVQFKNHIGLFPILRAGLGMVDGLLELVPTARVHHLGLYREKVSLLPVEYYNKLPAKSQVDLGIVLDPMVATAGTAIATLQILKDWGLKNIKFLCILASREGLDALRAAHPDVEIYAAAVDEELNDAGYVMPGLGDAGDRQFKTVHD